MKYQHRVPQEDMDHEIKPKFEKGKRPTCKVCGALLIVVDDNEGPEGLKALLRF